MEIKRVRTLAEMQKKVQECDATMSPQSYYAGYQKNLALIFGFELSHTIKNKPYLDS